jgi:hypothetical protein
VPKPGYSSGEALKAVQEVAAAYLPRGYAYEWGGLTREEESAGSQTTLIFIIHSSLCTSYLQRNTKVISFRSLLYYLCLQVCRCVFIPNHS